MPFAQETLLNYVTETIRDVVRCEVLSPTVGEVKLYAKPRIFDDLLSSQPLCFNLFAELQRDLDLASLTFSRLLAEPNVTVTGIEFEFSPGRGNRRFTGDHSAFDVFVTYQLRPDYRAFLGIEVKYAEDVKPSKTYQRARYEQVADDMGVFAHSERHRLRRAPLEQFWRDHLLAGSLALDEASGFRHGSFAVIYPAGNEAMSSAVTAYGACLVSRNSFIPWTLEHVLDVMDSSGAGEWAGEVWSRYIGGRLV